MLSATATRRFAALTTVASAALLSACSGMQIATPGGGVRIGLPGLGTPTPPEPTVAQGEYIIINDVTEAQRAAQGLSSVDLDKAFLGWKSPARDTFELVQIPNTNSMRLVGFSGVPLYYPLSVGQALKFADCRGKNRAQAPFDSDCIEPQLPSLLTARHSGVRATLDVIVNCNPRTTLVTKPQGTGLYTTCAYKAGSTVTSLLAVQKPEGIQVVKDAFIPR
jgi:hypothetical protein